MGGSAVWRSASINVDLQPRGGTVWCRLPCNKIPIGRPPFSGRVPGSGASESSLSQKSSDALRAERKSPRSSSSSPLMTEGAALGAKSRELDAATDLAPRASRINGSSQRPDAYRPPSWGFGTVPTVRALCRLGWAGARSKLGGREYECAVPFSVRSRMLQLFGRSSFKCSASTHGQNWRRPRAELLHLSAPISPSLPLGSRSLLRAGRGPRERIAAPTAALKFAK